MRTERPVAAITGASSGIGAVFARKLAASGWDLLLIARRRNRLEELAAELCSAHGIKAGILLADLARDDQLRSAEERLSGENRLELLVNNAGFGTLGPFFETDPERQDRMHRLHVVATVRLTLAALPGMVARRKGAVINVSSMAAFSQYPGGVSYCATKAWMNSFSEGLFADLKARGSPVKVQALCPGFTYTEFHDTQGFDRNKIPKSLWMTAEQVVEASLRGLANGELIVIPGWRYRVLHAVQKLVPMSIQRDVAIRYARKLGRIPNSNP